jgi:uncharacterized membrane protein required for colicin V production
MGLDIALGLIALGMAVSGYRHGFWQQIMRLLCLVVGLYAAEPIAIRLEPFVVQHIKLEDPKLLQRGLWWFCWALMYTLGSLLIGFSAKVSKWRKSPLQAELEPPGKFDPIMGFLFGLAKAVVAAAFISAATDRYAIPKIEHKEWAKKYVAASKALEYSRKYEPVPKILAAEPIKSMLTIIQERGLGGESTKEMISSLKIPKEEWDRLYSLRDKGVNLIEKTKTVAKESSKVLDEAQDLVKKSEVLKNAMSDTDKSKR